MKIIIPAMVFSRSYAQGRKPRSSCGGENYQGQNKVAYWFQLDIALSQPEWFQQNREHLFRGCPQSWDAVRFNNV